MKTNLLSGWQVELLREALAILASGEQQSGTLFKARELRRRRQAKLDQAPSEEWSLAA